MEATAAPAIELDTLDGFLAHEARLPDDTLVPLLKADVVPMETLHQRYGPLLKLVRALIGVVPNCDTYLEIWPPAFRTYNIMVPNLLDLPFGIFGIGDSPKDLVGLGMYVASRAAECPYCSAHTCSFALRRGAMLETVARALDRDAADDFTPKEQATIAVARSLGRVPCELDDDERAALEALFRPEEAAWIVYGVVMMGFLNKFMDTIGVELEASTAAETAATMGADWSAGKADTDLQPGTKVVEPPKGDSLWDKISIVPLLPKALMLDSKWQRGVPKAWPAVGEFLRTLCGHDFPILARLPHKRVVRAIASMLRENLNAETAQIGRELKVLAGVIFCEVVGDAPVAQDMRALAEAQGVTAAQIDAALAFARDAAQPAPGETPKARAALHLARAASPSPAEVTPELVAELRAVEMTPAEIVEVVTWVSVLQMLHRVNCYYVAA